MVVRFAVTAVSDGTLGAPVTLPSGALLTVNADGTFSYNPNHLFDYLPTPGSGASNLTYHRHLQLRHHRRRYRDRTVTVSGVDTNDVLYDSAEMTRCAAASATTSITSTTPATW